MIYEYGDSDDIWVMIKCVREGARKNEKELQKQLSNTLGENNEKEIKP